MEDIQSWWELPSIAHFCSLFRAAFDLLDFDIEELEEAILTDGFDRSGSPLLIELLVRLLQGCLPGRNITPCNVDSYLRKLFRQKCQEDPTRENIFVEGEFRKLALRKKVEVLHALCDFRLEAEDVLDLLKNLETESLRVEPLGFDDNGSTYWYFYGTRLYREDNSMFHPLRRRPREKEKDKEDKRKKKRKKKGHKEDSGGEEDEPIPYWQVQCYTEEDWKALSKTFEGCESRLEKSLLQTLTDDFLPEIPRLFEEKEKIQQKRMLEFAPRRMSGRVQKMKEKKEEEERRLAEELVVQEKKRIQEEEKRRLEEEEVVEKEVLEIENEEELEEVVRRVKEDEEEDDLLKREAEEVEETIRAVEEKKETKGKKRKRKEEEGSNKRIERWFEREDEVLHELNKPSKDVEAEERQRHHRNHKQKKPHHRKHHKRSHHSRPTEASLLDHQIASDTSNKENSCVAVGALSGDEDDLTRPEDDLSRPEDDLTQPEDDLTQPEDDLTQHEDDLTQPQVYSGRKTNNSLSSLAFSLTPASVVPEPTAQMVTSPPNKKRVKSAHMLLQTEDDLKTGMYKVLEHLRDHEDAWPFLDPVDETFAPNYYAVIRRPMYITKMESRLDSGFYTSLVLFEADFKLMMDNCKLYNGPESEYTHMAYTLEKAFAKLRSKYLETEFSSDEEIYIDMSFQQLSKRKNKKKSTEEKKGNEEETRKRGKKKKGKVGRKPKRKPEEEKPVEKKSKEKVKKEEKREEKEKSKGKKKNRHKNKEKDTETLHEEFDVKEEEIMIEKEAKDSKEREEEEEEEEEDDEDEYEEPLLLVREDPYPEEEDEDEESAKYRQSEAETRLETPPPSDLEQLDDSAAGGVIWDSTSPRVGALSPVPTKWKKEPDKESPLKEEETYRRKKAKRKKKRDEENSDKGEMKSPENIVGLGVSDSESDTAADGVLLYYRMEEEEEEKKDHVIERHSELFGEIEDIDEEDERRKEGDEENIRRKEGRKGQGSHSTRSGKRRSSSGKVRKRHRHGAASKHHHHKNKSKHHHRRRDRHNNVGKESPGKKVLKVEEVFEYSEDDPNSRDPEGVSIPMSPRLQEEGDTPIEGKPGKPDLSSETAPPRKKNRRKGKHSKHVKRKEAREKARKASKRRSIKKIIKKKRKQIPIQKMAAIDALSAATEQTLKDITSLLDDPEVPRFTGESPEEEPPFPSQRVTSQEFDSIALKIETEYRRKLKMDSSEEKKVHKKKKKQKQPDVPDEEGGCHKKKKPEEKEKEKERKATEFLLDNTKELFKDIKDGRIKPGAIIKSKDIAKKEGVVKKETKTPAEAKPKGKQNPFGKINKQENSKLTTLIAKAKESRIGLVPNSEVGDSPKLSLGSIILFGDIGSGKHSSREPNSPEEEDKMSDKAEKWDSPWDNRWERPPDIKEETSNPPPSQPTEEEEEEIEEVDEVSQTPERPPEEIIPPPTPRGPEFKQERATPNLSAWFRAFGGPKLTAAPRKKMDDDDDEEEDEENREEDVECSEDVEEMKEQEDVEKKDEVDEDEEIKVNSPEDSVHNIHTSVPGSPNNNSIDPPISPQPPLSPEKPPETPWFDKIGEKEDEPIWKKSKSDEEDDPYKFEEEELDRAREEAKKLEVERQRKASVSSSGLSDPSPLNIDSDRSPAAFSSEGERSPLTCSPVTRSPVTRSPVTPGFGTTKQFSPVTDKSPSVPVYSPRFDTGLGKTYVGYEDKSKYQANGTLKVGFYQDMTDKNVQDKSDTPKGLDQKIKESPIYSPTVPYVSPLYSNKDQAMCKQKSPGRYSSYYSSIDSSTMDKPKTPGYYSTSAPSTPSDRPSSVAPGPTEDKSQPQYNYYNYDPTKSLTDQYKSTGSNSTKPFYPNDISSKGPDRSPISNSVTPAPGPVVTPVGLGSPLKIVSKPSTTTYVDKSDMQPPKKRQAVERAHSQLLGNTPESLLPSWDDKRSDSERSMTVGRSNPFSPHPLPANLANLSHIISRIPEPEPEPSLDKGSALLTKTVQPTHPAHLFEPSAGLSQPSPSNLPQSSLLSGRSVDMPLTLDLDHSPISELSHASPLLVGKNPPAAHQKVTTDGERPGSRNMPPPHSGEKPHGYLHQKTMWSSSLPTSIPSSLSSLVSNATMASIALAGSKGLGSFPSEHLAQFGIASLAGRSSQAGGQLFSHDLLQRNPPSQNQTNSSSLSSASGLSLQPHLNGTSSVGGSSSSSAGHSRSGSVNSGSSTSIQSGTGSSSSIGTGSASSNNFELGLARSYASMMSANQSSPLLVRNEAPLTPGSLPRSLSGSSSPFLPQSPGLGAALSMSGSARTPTPAHQQPIGQGNFAAIPRDPRDPISQSHPSLQIPSLNSIAVSQAQSLSHLNAAGLASYNPRDSLALMNQGGRGPLVGVEPTPQQIYQQYLQRHQFAQEELLLRSAGAHSQLAHQSMMIQQGLMSAAGVSYPSGYPHSLGLRSGTYQSMNRPWI